MYPISDRGAGPPRASNTFYPSGARDPRLRGCAVPPHCQPNFTRTTPAPHSTPSLSADSRPVAFRYINTARTLGCMDWTGSSSRSLLSLL